MILCRQIFIDSFICRTTTRWLRLVKMFKKRPYIYKLLQFEVLPRICTPERPRDRITSYQGTAWLAARICTPDKME